MPRLMCVCVCAMSQCLFFQKFDANGDGNVDLAEFRLMVKVTRKAVNFFTGSEELERLTDEQMAMFLLFDAWPKKHVGPGVYKR